jgi:hypothetical protein
LLRFIPEIKALISEINDKLSQPEIQPTEEARSIHARKGKIYYTGGGSQVLEQHQAILGVLSKENAECFRHG